jgi:hypothetical protein
MGWAGTWIGIGVFVALLSLVATDVVLKVGDPWDGVVAVFVFLAVLIFGVSRQS